MFAELDILGAFIPAIAVWFAVTVVIFLIADVVMTRIGLYRLFWHAPLVRFSLYVCLFCAGCAVINTN